MPYEGSLNYIWGSRLLGKGTGGIVYLGYHKKTASKCAVKVFKQTASNHAFRELEMTKTIDHVNIVKVLAIETSARSRDQVLIMEYCNLGNLYNLLKKPIYFYGLLEKQVVAFLGQMGDVMEYLHKKGVIHRDWKPGNILVCRESKQGGLLFKVGDFGTAKILEEDAEDFSTIHGTVEYLHPVLLKDMVARKKDGGSYSTKSDLWSFGATLYQVVTGQLPFVVSGGRRDAPGLSEMVLIKPDNAISGTKDEQGHIVWKKELPDTCRLSPYLRQFLTNLLVRLLQNDLQNDDAYTYKELFADTKELKESVVVHMFSFLTCTHHHLYLRKKSKLSHLKEAIAQLTEIPAGDQVLILNNHFLEEAVGETWKVDSYPATSPEDPLVLLAPERLINLMWTTGTCPLPNVPMFKPERESQTALEMPAIAQLVKRETSEVERSCHLIDIVLLLSGSILQTEQFYKARITFLLNNSIRETETHFIQMYSLLGDILSRGREQKSSTLEARTRDVVEDFNELKSFLRALEQQLLRPEDVDQSTDTSRTSSSSLTSFFGLASALWTTSSGGVQKLGDSTSEESLEYLAENIQERHDEIKSLLGKQQRDTNEEQILQVEKYYIRKATDQLVSKLKSRQQALKKKHRHSRDWIKNFLHQKDRKKVLETQLVDCESRRQQLRAKHEQEIQALWNQVKEGTAAS